MCVTVRFYISVCRLAVTKECSAGFYPVTEYSHQRVGGTIQNGNQKCFSRLALNTSEHPMTFHFVSPIVLPPTELVVSDFGGLVRTNDFLKSSQHIIQHALCAEFDPISDGCKTELKLLLDSVSRNATKDECEKQNLHIFQVTLLKPLTVPT